MNAKANPSGPARVFCEACGKPVSIPDAMRIETNGEVQYFCGPACYESRRGEREPAPGPHEVQGGQGRSKLRDERMKTLARQHPQRDEPRVDSVENDELPPP